MGYTKSVMFIRTRDEALKAVADWLDLPEQRDRIVQATVEVMGCLDPGSRSFLTDCMALLIKGGLEELRRRREETAIIILDPEEDALYNDLTEAHLALRFADVTMEIFPSLRRSFGRWEVARAIRNHEDTVREAVKGALVSRRDGKPHDEFLVTVEALILSTQPEWMYREADLRKACRNTGKGSEELFKAIVCCDLSATELLDALDVNPGHAVEMLIRVREFLDEIVEAIQESSPGADPRQVA